MPPSNDIHDRYTRGIYMYMHVHLHVLYIDGCRVTVDSMRKNREAQRKATHNEGTRLSLKNGDIL